MFTQVDLCSGDGIGFLFAGLKRGLKLIGVSETNPDCCEILSLRYPGVINYGDVNNYDWYGDTTEVDIITASPPCQPFSLQGKRLAADDKRNCFPGVLRAIANKQPKFIAIENVRGLLNCPYRPGANRSYFRYVLHYLSGIGFDLEWTVLSSGHFGAPFLRERVLLVGVARRLKPRWDRASPWLEQIRVSVAQARGTEAGGGYQPGLSRIRVSSPYWVDESTGYHYRWGVPSGDGEVRKRRAALGNALDPRLAGVALDRLLYLSQLCKKA